MLVHFFAICPSFSEIFVCFFYCAFFDKKSKIKVSSFACSGSARAAMIRREASFSRRQLLPQKCEVKNYDRIVRRISEMDVYEKSLECTEKHRANCA